MLSGTPRTFIGSTTFQVNGMTCAHCQRAVSEEIAAVAGVESVTVDLASGTVTVTADCPVDRADIAAAVDEAGDALVPCRAPLPLPGASAKPPASNAPGASHTRFSPPKPGARHDVRPRAPRPFTPAGADAPGAAGPARQVPAPAPALATPEPTSLRLTTRLPHPIAASAAASTGAPVTTATAPQPPPAPAPALQTPPPIAARAVDVVRTYGRGEAAVRAFDS